MTNRKHSATGNAGDGTNSQEQTNALYVAHQVHTLANLIYQRIQAGIGSHAAQGWSAGHAHPGAAQFQGAYGQAPSSHAGPFGGGHAQDPTAQAGAAHPFALAPFGATHGGAMNQTHPFFGTQSHGFTPYGAFHPTGSPFGSHPYFGNTAGEGHPFGFPGFANAGQSPFGWQPFFPAGGFGGVNPFGFAPFGQAFGGPTGNPYGFLPHWMFGNPAALQGGFAPQWGTNAGNAAYDGACCNTGAPRGAAFSPAPALFYWYP